MSEHPCPECQRMHLSDAEERAKNERNTRRLRGLNVLLVRGIEAARPSYGTQQMADWLTGHLAYSVMFPDTFMEDVEAAALSVAPVAVQNAPHGPGQPETGTGATPRLSAAPDGPETAESGDGEAPR